MCRIFLAYWKQTGYDQQIIPPLSGRNKRPTGANILVCPVYGLISLLLFYVVSSLNCRLLVATSAAAKTATASASAAATAASAAATTASSAAVGPGTGLVDVERTAHQVRTV